MKYLFNSYRIAGILGIVALITVSYACSDLAPLNNNPNEPDVAATTYLLTSAQKDLADNYWGAFPLGYFGNLYSQYWSQNQYTAESRYSYRTGVVNDIWNDYYTTMNTLQQIIRQNRNNPELASAYGNNANQIAVAKILKAWTFQTLTDIWGDIPYKEALEGASNPSPAYTSQDSVYIGIINMLTEASDSIKVDASGFTSGDVFYGGDMAKWKKFANSLKLRAAMRIADVKPELARTAAQEAVAAGVMESNADNALFTYLDAVPNNNPINEAYKTRRDFAVSRPLVNLLQSNNDPRLPIYADPAENTPEGTTIYAGYPYGMAQGAATAYLTSEPWSEPGARVRQADAPAIFMTYSEVLFAEAEAAQRGWISANPAAKYRQAIQASMDYWGVSESDAQTYIANNPYNAANWRTSIGQEKWVALYMQGIQGWAEWRRLDFGVLVEPQGGKLGVSFDAPIAVRYPYPTDEARSNGENLQAAIESQGFSADNQGQRVWWDVSANTAAN